MHCHHEKLVVIDDRVAFVGGIDLTALGGDRFDASDHPYRGAIGWHDAAVMHPRPRSSPTSPTTSQRAGTRSTASGSTRRRVPDPAGSVELQLVRTVPERVYDVLPATVTSASSRPTHARCARPSG